ncbi:hypothetical protein N184_18325 [Sinorhizobium sp. GL28]|nr:hypothetical protein N184_18325 [Sinorhizobium sp. GL28]
MPRCLKPETGLFDDVGVVCPKRCDQLLFQICKQPVQHSAFSGAFEALRGRRGSIILLAPTGKKVEKYEGFIGRKADFRAVGK